MCNALFASAILGVSSFLRMANSNRISLLKGEDDQWYREEQALRNLVKNLFVSKRSTNHLSSYILNLNRQKITKFPLLNLAQEI